MVDIATTLRLSLRGAQFVLSLFALSFTAGGFYSDSAQMIGSHATNFGMFMTYTTLLYSAYQLAVIEHFRLVPQLPNLVVVGTDAVMAVILFIAGIVLATSDYVAHCDSYGFLLKCGNLTAGTVFTFFTMVAFIGSVVLAYMGRLTPTEESRDMEGGQDTYIQESTPKALSPIGAPSPSSKV